ncbi:uncharacterized protein [Littorina saxatilis]|uniref:uncharacterized protein n=1 Tax=Littorina saxatilis TaxID=31220 RepID=UPI0038B56CE0
MSESLLFLLLMCLCVGLISSDATKCFRSEDLGNAEGNVYHCYEDKPDCCEQDSEFTCCEAESSKTWKEQLQLWGTVAGVVAVMLLVCCCFKSDGICNGTKEGESSFMDRFRRKRQEPALTDLSHADPATKTTSLSYDRLPPLPPVTPLPEKNNYGFRGRSNSGYEDDDGYLR